ncbi:EpsG family protein [Affinibrenneria salicis]|uniref:EpsG family protein n=1 Tax=Affinibrenneria salicis TaxID=2590031 RepID=A0A5J5G045_9GAMM|nr:EpsG family protein [Affinibrenneria salicis]KAA8999859.1 EpsG family protein [Affinibrenneria salicis]
MPLFFSNLNLSIYFFLSLFLFFLSFLAARYKNNKLDILNTTLVAVMMVCFYAFREPGATDLIMYFDYYDRLDRFEDFPWGLSFYWLMLSIKTINASHEAYLFGTAIYFVILILFFSFLFFKDKCYKSLILLSFFYGWSILDLATNTYRQGVAAPCAMIACYFFFQRRLLLFSLFTAISVGLHWGALVPILLGVCAFVLSKNIKILKFVSVLVLLLYTLSFFIDLSLAKIFVNSTFIQYMEKIFVGVNISDKIYSYLNSEVNGADFYDLPIMTRLKFTIESYLPLLINVFFLLTRNKKNSDIFEDNKTYISVVSYIVLLNLYAVSIISMAWFFRNFYWLPFISMTSLIFMISSYEKKKYYPALLVLYILMVVAVSILTNWSSELLKMSYPIM